MRCRLDRLAAWAERAPSSWIASLSGDLVRAPGGGPGEAEVLLLGPAARLPVAEDGLRFWGDQRPDTAGLSGRARPGRAGAADAVGAGADDLVVLDADGPELVPRRAFQPLCRAGIRLALAGTATGRPTEEAAS